MTIAQSNWRIEWQEKRTSIPTCGLIFFSVLVIWKANKALAKWRCTSRYHQENGAIMGFAKSITHPF